MRLNISYIFHGLGLLTILFACLLGLTYITKGSEIGSVGGALGIALLLSTFVHLMIKGKSRNKDKGITTFENKGITATEVIALVLYIATAFASFYVIRHSINVDYLLKEEIIKDSKNKLAQNKAMFEAYKDSVETTVRIIDTELLSALQRGSSYSRKAFEESGSNRANNTERKNIKIANEKRAMQDLISLEQDFAIFKQQKEQTLNNWKRFRLHRTLLEIDDKYDNTFAVLQTKFKAPEENKAWNRFSFEYPISPRQDNLLTSPFALVEKYQPSIIIPLLGTLLAHFFVLMPYLFIERFGIGVVYPDKWKSEVTGIE
jgi:hypothetical protein